MCGGNQINILTSLTTYRSDNLIKRQLLSLKITFIPSLLFFLFLLHLSPTKLSEWNEAIPFQYLMFVIPTSLSRVIWKSLVITTRRFPICRNVSHRWPSAKVRFRVEGKLSDMLLGSFQSGKVIFIFYPLRCFPETSSNSTMRWWEWNVFRASIICCGGFHRLTL